MRMIQSTTLWYIEEINRFQNSRGDIVHDVSDLIDIYKVERWKRSRVSTIFESLSGNLLKLVFVPRGIHRDYFEPDIDQRVYTLWNGDDFDGGYIYE